MDQGSSGQKSILKAIQGLQGVALNHDSHNAFSIFRQIAASGLSGNKLILTISFPP
jgi:hypothetical protein